MENEKSQTTKEKRNPSKKTRSAIIGRYVAEEREKVIRADLELSFLQDIKKKYPDSNLPTGVVSDETELQNNYDYHLARLVFFKGLRDKMGPIPDTAVKAIKEDIEKNTPENIKVQKEKKG